jgi:molybdenum cofactor cytidylyltransferase
MIAAIILAAGESVRMGSPKALLAAPDGHAFVARIVRAFAAAGVADVTIVTGSQHAAIVDAIAADRPPLTPRVVVNPDPSRGQLSSLWTGLDAVLHPGLDAVLVTLVDVPMVRPATIRAVIDAWTASRAPVVRPAIGERHGHPVLFDRALFDELRHAPLDEGARAVVRAHAGEVVNVPVEDEGPLLDVDTPADYEAMIRRES